MDFQDGWREGEGLMELTTKTNVPLPTVAEGQSEAQKHCLEGKGTY